MSLLFTEGHEKAYEVAKEICSNFGQTKPMSNPAGDGQQEIPYDGLAQTIILLDVAVRFDDEAFFRWTGIWAYMLFANRLPQPLRPRAKGFVVQFCSLLKTQLFWYETEDERQRAVRMLDAAIDEVQKADLDGLTHSYIAESGHEILARAYLDKVLVRDMAGAMALLQSAASSLPLDEVYTQIVQSAMYEVGELWLTNKITVAQEHYCTAATQTMMASMYSQVIDRPRNGRKAVIACIGSELHELGPRMVSDILEYHGWDCVFLGAGVPLDALLETIGQENPEMCCLSVTLQQGVPECARDVAAIKERYPGVITAVGGHAFVELKNAREQMGADIFADDMQKLLEESDRMLSEGSAQ